MWEPYFGRNLTFQSVGVALVKQYFISKIQVRKRYNQAPHLPIGK